MRRTLLELMPPHQRTIAAECAWQTRGRKDSHCLLKGSVAAAWQDAPARTAADWYTANEQKIELKIWCRTLPQKRGVEHGHTEWQREERRDGVKGFRGKDERSRECDDVQTADEAVQRCCCRRGEGKDDALT